MKTPIVITEKEVEWLAEARRYADHRYCYKQMVDEHIEFFNAMYLGDANPYDTVDVFGEKYDLDRADDSATWGINSGKEFVKTWP